LIVVPSCRFLINKLTIRTASSVTKHVTIYTKYGKQYFLYAIYRGSPSLKATGVELHFIFGIKCILGVRMTNYEKL
jgi:hypothetical protein